MGLAASQARFLGLTARKSNVEFQGQQINQARTALSNEVNGLYEKYNDLKVPVPPSINEYVKTVYKLDSTYEGYEIQNFSKILDGENEGYYNVELKYTDSVATVYPYTSKNARITALKGDEGYSKLNFELGSDSYYYDENDENSTITKITDNYEKYPGLTTIMEKEGKTDGIYYMFQKDDMYIYTSQADLEATAFSELNDGSQVYSGAYMFEYQGSKKEEKTINAVAALTQDSTGRISSIRVVDCEDDIDLINNTYSVSTTATQDEMAYNDALNQYGYEKQKYEQEVEKINKETAKIQQEDRSLELKLNQLDTEERALKTEMDTIKTVLKDTIESVFKTYDS